VDDQGKGVDSREGQEMGFFLKSVETGCGVHPGSPGVKLPYRGSDQPLLLSASVENTWISTSTLT
jgi:hypothetical protein